MQAVLTFNLPEDEAELLTALAGMDHIAAIHDYQERLRNLHKYGHGFESTEQALESLYSDYCAIMQDFL